jgi:hypothetical protein
MNADTFEVSAQLSNERVARGASGSLRRGVVA